MRHDTNKSVDESEHEGGESSTSILRIVNDEVLHNGTLNSS